MRPKNRTRTLGNFAHRSTSIKYDLNPVLVFIKYNLNKSMQVFGKDTIGYNCELA